MWMKSLPIEYSSILLDCDMIGQKGNFAIIFCDGKAKVTLLPDHGETKIITHQGKVKRVKFDVGEEF